MSVLDPQWGKDWARILNLLSKEVKRVGSLREGKEARKARKVFAPVTLHEEGPWGAVVAGAGSQAGVLDRAHCSAL